MPINSNNIAQLKNALSSPEIEINKMAEALNQLGNQDITQDEMAHVFNEFIAAINRNRLSENETGNNAKKKSLNLNVLSYVLKVLRGDKDVKKPEGCDSINLQNIDKFKPGVESEHRLKMNRMIINATRQATTNSRYWSFYDSKLASGGNQIDLKKNEAPIDLITVAPLPVAAADLNSVSNDQRQSKKVDSVVRSKSAKRLRSSEPLLARGVSHGGLSASAPGRLTATTTVSSVAPTRRATSRANFSSSAPSGTSTKVINQATQKVSPAIQIASVVSAPSSSKMVSDASRAPEYSPSPPPLPMYSDAMNSLVIALTPSWTKDDYKDKKEGRVSDASVTNKAKVMLENLYAWQEAFSSQIDQGMPLDTMLIIIEGMIKYANNKTQSDVSNMKVLYEVLGCIYSATDDLNKEAVAKAKARGETFQVPEDLRSKQNKILDLRILASQKMSAPSILKRMSHALFSPSKKSQVYTVAHVKLDVAQMEPFYKNEKALRDLLKVMILDLKVANAKHIVFDRKVLWAGYTLTTNPNPEELTANKKIEALRQIVLKEFADAGIAVHQLDKAGPATWDDFIKANQKFKIQSSDYHPMHTDHFKERFSNHQTHDPESQVKASVGQKKNGKN